MRILFVLDRVENPASANAQLACRLAEQLLAQGHEIHLLELWDGENPPPAPPAGASQHTLAFADERLMNHALENGAKAGSPVPLRLLRLGPPVTDCLRQYGLTERHARALLRLTDPEQQLAAARHMGQRGLNVAQAEQYIDALAAQNRTEPLRRRPTYIIKDVRLFLNSVERGVRLMQSAGVGAEVGRRDTDEEILLTIHIPKRRPTGVVTDS